MIHELSPNAQTAYAQVFDAAFISSINQRSIELSGGFSTKTVKGKVYHYYQYRDLTGKVVQEYLGPNSDRVNSLIDRVKTGKVVQENLQKLSRSAISLGCHDVVSKHFKPIIRLAEYGFFKGGGILVGTHAFIAMGNMLGIDFGDALLTHDIDFAHPGKNISIALNPGFSIDTAKAIESLEMGMVPISGVNGKLGATYLDPENPSYRFDFLTSKISEDDAPIEVPGITAALQPLKFMEFSMQDPVQAVVLSQEGCVLVNIPKPEYYAIHKLIISGERQVSEQMKSNKDLRQASILIEYYAANRYEDLFNVVQDARRRGTGWRERMDRGIESLKSIAPGVVAELNDIIVKLDGDESKSSNSRHIKHAK